MLPNPQSDQYFILKKENNTETVHMVASVSFIHKDMSTAKYWVQMKSLQM